MRARFLPYMLVLLAAWTPWLVLVWPGSMRDDTLAQYLQSAGIHRYYTQHPLFDTLVFGLFWRTGAAFGSPLAGEALYTLVQVLALAAGSAFLLCYVRKIGVPRWLRALGLVYLATSYVVVGSIATMGKDSLHTVFFLPAAVLFTEVCRTRGRVLRRMPVAVAFTLLLFAVVASKRTALVIVLCAGVCMLFACRGAGRANRHRPAVCLVAAIVLAQGVFAPLATAATHANVSPGREVWGLVTQPVAQVAHDDPSAITPDQRRTLEKVMDLDRAAANINQHRTNETFATLRTGHGKAASSGASGDAAPSASDKLAALGVWARLGLAHPDEYAKAYAGPIRGWWDPTVNFAYPTDSDYLLRPGYLRQWASFVDPSTARTPQARLKAITRDLTPLMGTSDRPAWKRDALRAVRDWVRPQARDPQASNPLTAMALYVTWMPSAIGVALAVRWVRRRRASGSAASVACAHLAAYALLFFTVLSLYASPEALFWYPIPVFFSLPLFATLPFADAPCRA
ncbi:hypothetical protein JS531_05210 [Bifidobacterium sp. CP2]|uniref:DUF6020 family protein n=1 Tax=Bifidobacterium sp. CP2 TaxID=2809025 RepID=UPI001BDBF384|nr:DUF6020 family protein [Bifidobacterium sp. CP2]MBT1181376.1 hypothetical protein [Bifidobacterium sp. CP2]